jgi:putative oxidoreductase
MSVLDARGFAGPAPATVANLRWYETAARYLLGAIYLYGAIDGALFLFFGIYIHGRPFNRFLVVLQTTTYFWAFMKLIQLIGAMGLLTNYKPALSVALLIPIAAVQCLFYLFEAPVLIPLGLIILVVTAILCRAYAKSYAPLLDKYS